MPKMKSNSGAKKRFRFTGTGKVRQGKAYASHILTKKSSKRKRRIRGLAVADSTTAKQVHEMLPYGRP
jgi:large subunit ribosomal protein L35